MIHLNRASCPHPDDQLQLAVDNRGAATRVLVICNLCVSSWTPMDLPSSLLDRCLELFEGMKR